MSWIPVSERLPPSEENVLFVASFEDGPSVCFGFKVDGDPDSRWWVDVTVVDGYGDHLDVFDVTHWMPIPALPAG